MARLNIVTMVLAAAFLAPAAQAAEKTVVLSVENATCELCGPIVKKALLRVSGVRAVQFQEPSASDPAVATVTFDEATVDVPKLIAATTNAGYLSQLKN
jgi:periplasmic mercuric ion binding protein